VSSISTTNAEGPVDFCGSGVFIVEEVDGMGDKRSGDTTTVNMQIFLKAFSKDFQTWDYFPQLLKYQDLWSISIQIKGVIL
jgi:hypothetical protein